MAAMSPVDEYLVVDNPREFGGRVPICTGVTTMSSPAWIMCDSFQACEVDQTEQAGVPILNYGTENGLIIVGGGIMFWGYVLVVGLETGNHPALIADCWRHIDVNMHQRLLIKGDIPLFVQ